MGPIDISAVRRIHAKFSAQNARLFVQAADFAGEAAENHVRTASKFKVRGGAASAKYATTHKVIRTSSGAIVRISNPKKYAQVLEHGSAAHYIFAREGHFLRFRGRGGQFVFRMRVRHPGTRGFRFLYNATDAAHRVLGRYLTTEMDALAKKF